MDARACAHVRLDRVVQLSFFHLVCVSHSERALHLHPALAAAAAPAAAPAASTITDLDAAYERGELHGKQRDAARKRKERREKTAAAIAALHLPDEVTAAAIVEHRKGGVKVNPASDTHQLKRHRERQAEYRRRKSAVASPARPAVASPARPAAPSPPRPAAMRTELNTQDLDVILGYSSSEILRPVERQHAEESKEMEPELSAYSPPPVHPPSIPGSMQLPLPSISPSPIYDYLPATSSFPAAAAAAASLSPPPAASPPVRSPSPKRARSSAASGVRASGLRRKPLAQLVVPQRQAAAAAASAWRNSQDHNAKADADHVIDQEGAVSTSALPLLHHPPALGAIPNEPLSVELTASILSKLDEWHKGESAAAAAAYAAGTATTSKQERMTASTLARRQYASARRIELKLLMGPKCASMNCNSTITLENSNVRWFHCDHLDPSTKLDPDDILCNCQSITSLQRFLLKNIYNGRLYLQLLCLHCHAIKSE